MSQQIDNVINALQQENFSNAASLVINNPKINDVVHEAIEEELEKLQSPSAQQIQKIIDVSSKYHNNIATLKSTLDNLNHSKNSEKSKPGAVFVNEAKIKKLTNLQLKRNIESAKINQQEILQEGQKPDEKLAKKLSFMLQEKNIRENPNQTKGIRFSDHVGKLERPEGANNWFVLPSAADLETKEDVSVVIGSPSIDVLRERYVELYNIDQIQQISQEDLKNMSAEKQYAAQREISRQIEFTQNYRQPDTISDQDIFVSQVASKFLIDKHVSVPYVKDPKNTSIKSYIFPDGQINIEYNFEKKTHYIDTEGHIAGRTSIAIKRRTDSGRIIDDSYSIVEFEDGEPIFYTHSTKGTTSIGSINAIKRAVESKKMDLSEPKMASILSSERTEEVKKSILKQREQKQQIAQENSKETSQKQSEAAPLKKSKISTEPKQLQTTEEIKNKNSINTKSQPIEKPQNTSSKAEQKQDSDSNTESSSDKTSLRGQLKFYISENASLSTKTYLAKQIAEKEGKDIEDIYKEFKIDVKQESKSLKAPPTTLKNTPEKQTKAITEPSFQEVIAKHAQKIPTTPSLTETHNNTSSKNQSTNRKSSSLPSIDKKHPKKAETKKLKSDKISAINAKSTKKTKAIQKSSENNKLKKKSKASVNLAATDKKTRNFSPTSTPKVAKNKNSQVKSR